MKSQPISMRFLLIASLAAGAPAFSPAAETGPTFRLIDLNRTGQSGLSPYFDPLSFAAAGDTVYFPAWSIAEGVELWRSDGTEPGTRLVADLWPGSLSAAPGQLTAAGQDLYFLASDASGTYQLFSLSNSAPAPLRVSSFDPGAAGTPAILGVAGADHRTAIFTYTASGPVELWAATAPGPPVLLKSFVAGPLGPAFGGSDVSAHGAWLHFSADDGMHGRELWRTDGTVAGTVLESDIVPGPEGSSPTSIAAFNGRILVSATAPGHGSEPWVIDPGGARQLMDIGAPNEPTLGSAPAGFAEIGGRIVFSAQTAGAGRELWVTDGSAEAGSTHLLRDIKPGPGDGVDATMKAVLFADRLYFAADDGTHGPELWSTDGTPDGTRLEADVRPGPTGGSPLALLSFAGSLVFQAATDDAGYRLWRLTPDSTGNAITSRISDLPFSDDDAINRLAPRPCAAIGDRMVFPAFRLDCGLELFTSNAAGESSLVKDIRVGTTTSAPGLFTRLGRSVLFTARNELGAEPWISDGSGERTHQIADIVPGRIGSNPASLISGRDFVVFRATVNGSTRWWRTDGSTAIDPAAAVGAVPLGVAEPQQAVAPRAAALGGSMIFAGRSTETGDEPFVTDGHETQLLRDIGPGARSSSPFCFFRLGQRVVFFASIVPGTADLWSTDGTPEHTEQFATIINPLRARVVSTAVRPVVAGDRLFFVASDGSGDELWSTAGDEQSTRIVTDIVPGPRGSSPTGLCASRGADGRWRVFFAATDDDHGAELWCCRVEPDGSLTSNRVRDIAPGSPGSSPFTIMADPNSASGNVYFVASDGIHGFELWVSDGAETGTFPITNLDVSRDAAVQSVLGVLGSRVYVRVVDPGAISSNGLLYLADSSPAGASPVLDGAGQPIVPASSIVRVDSRAFLAVSDRAAGTELGVIDLCPADFDNSGAISVDDLFSFLADWIPRAGRIAPGQAADYSGDGVIGVDDLLGFLAAYFADCP